MKTKLYPEIRERAVQLLIESEKIIHRIGQQFPQLLLKLAVLLKRVWYQKYLDQQNPAKVQQVSDQEK